jgi:hydroxyacylglutathione hydrolase
MLLSPRWSTATPRTCRSLASPKTQVLLPLVLLSLCSLGCSSSDPDAMDCDRCDESDADAALPDAALPDAEPVDLCTTLGSYPDAWISGGPDCGTEPEIQVHRLNDDTYILRQSLCTSAEAPFLYLLLGDDKALLEDTGDGGIDLVSAVNTIVAEREAALGHEIELIVVNSHAHNDHVGANQAFATDGATVVGASDTALSSFFGMGWPHEVATFDLGNRIIEIAGIPGHQPDHISIYDRQYGILLTGDTLYPGRLFINDFAAYKASITFLIGLVEDRDLCAVLGTHIEMSTTPGDDYDFGVDHHPNERALALSRDTLLELRAAIELMGNTPVRQTHDDFIIFPL